MGEKEKQAPKLIPPFFFEAGYFIRKENKRVKIL